MAWFGDKKRHAIAARKRKSARSVQSIFDAPISNREKRDFFVDKWKKELQKKKPNWVAIKFYKREAWIYGHKKPVYALKSMVKK